MQKYPKLLAALLTSVGIILLYALPNYEHGPTTWNTAWRVVEHLGVAIVIAGLIAFALETDHFIDYVEGRLSRILTKREFINLLDPESLRSVQESITVRLLGYPLDEDMRKLYGDSNEFLLKVLSENYRRNYVSNVTITDADEDPDMFLVRTEVSYELVSPARKSTTEIPIELSSTKRKHPSFNGKYMKSCKIYENDKELNVEQEEKEEGGYVTWTGKATVSFEGSTNIRTEREQLIWKGDSPVFATRMTHVTRNVTMFVKMAAKQSYVLEARTFGFFESKTLGVGHNAISVHFMDWMLTKNGIIVTWQESKEAVHPS